MNETPQVRKAKVELTFQEFEYIQSCLQADTWRLEKLANECRDPENQTTLWAEAQKTRLFRGDLAHRFFSAEDEDRIQNYL